MNLTDQKVNTRKTKSFGLPAGPDLKYEGKTLDTTQSVKVLGVSDDKIDKMCCLAHRMRWAGPAFHQRELLCSSLIMSEVLYGIEVTDLNTFQKRKLRTAVGYAIWAKTDKARNPSVYTTCHMPCQRSWSGTFCETLERTSQNNKGRP